MNSVLHQVAIPGAMERALASGLFVSRCSIMQPDGTLIDAGQPSGAYIPVGEMQNIPCTAAPTSDIRITANQQRTQDDIQAFAPLHVSLAGYYPTIKEGVSQGWIAVIDGSVYTLLGAESSSQGQITRLSVRFAGV
jgi:hypothetical protein